VKVDKRKATLFIAVFCFTGVFVIIVYYLYELRDIYSHGDEGLGVKKIEKNTNFDDKDNFSEITLTWDTVSNATSYNLYWSNKPGVTKKNGHKIVNVHPPFKFNQIKKGLIYYFVVTAVNQSAESSESEEKSFFAHK
jgi:hypothetical protein